MKRIIIVFTLFILIIIIVVGIIITYQKLTTKSFDNVNQEMEYIVRKFVDKNKLVRNSVLSVMKGDGSFSWSGAAGIASQDNQLSMTKDTPLYIASIDKLYISTAIMKLYEEGMLSLDDPMSKYLTENFIRGIHVYKGKDYSNEITIKQLLSHTSGIADYYDEKSPKDNKNIFELYLEYPERSWTEDEKIERVRNDMKPNFKPGTDASYSDTNFLLLEKIIETITSKPINIVYEEFFFRPLSLEYTWLIDYSRSQVTQSTSPADVFYKDINITKIRSSNNYRGSLVSTAEEMIIFLKALNEGRIISKDTLKLMHNWHKLHQFPLQYGYGTMYFKLPFFMMKITPLWGHSGSIGSFLYYSEDLDLYMAGSINQVESKIKSFILIQSVIKVIQKKSNYPDSEILF